ncbi:hypothetical protein KAR91_43050 [Candidatus Pacearchaeota archaeon]|nr:hypothetical protein [Candidatus Pacearchaeota archaeon]
MKVGIFYMPNGSVIVRTFAPKSRRVIFENGVVLTQRPGLLEELAELQIPYEFESEEQWMERVMTENPRSSSSEIIDNSELPQSREDRDAWTGKKGEGVSIDQGKAEELRTNKDAKTKIGKKIRNMAIESLKDEGELSPDYEE